ncbi:MAG: sigma-70 family RNA polymerase sigma factor [Bacillota bacterium]
MLQFSVTISLIQEGDERLREEFIASQKEFIRSFASLICRKRLDWHNDDELSVALLAFNRAIDTFNPEAGSSFLSYARMLIRNSLVDNFRRAQKGIGSEGGSAMEELSDHLETAASLERHALHLDNLELAYEIGVFKESLGSYGLSLETLVKHSPRHRDTREKLKEITLEIARDKKLRERIIREKRLPLQEVQSASGAKRKMLEKWRKYILSLFIIATHGELEILAEYIWGKELLRRP